MRTGRGLRLAVISGPCSGVTAKPIEERIRSGPWSAGRCRISLSAARLRSVVIATCAVGVTGVVHTWARNLSFHPHLHCIVTGGGLGADGVWGDSPEKFLLPVKVLGKLFRGKFLAGLSRLFDAAKLAPSPRTKQAVADLVEPTAFARLKIALYAKDWVAYAKTPFRKPDALSPWVMKASLFAHGRIAAFASRTRGLAQHDVQSSRASFRTTAGFLFLRPDQTPIG